MIVEVFLPMPSGEQSNKEGAEQVPGDSAGTPVEMSGHSLTAVKN